MNILICTVGGSRAPVVSAVRSCRADKVEFVCSDGSSGSASSAGEAPAIAGECSVGARNYSVLRIPPDDPDAALQIIRRRIGELRGQFPDVRLLADYTGGTKSMSAALMYAAMVMDIPLQITTGARGGLDRVETGSERARRVSLDFIIAERDLSRALQSWKNYAYSEAAGRLREIWARLGDAPGIANEFCLKVRQLQRISEAFAAWDRFDHDGALALLQPFAEDPEIARYAAALRRIVDSGAREPAILFDLWNNSVRAAHGGRHDDATARLYRMIEWTAQWMLRLHCAIDTGRVELTRVPEEMRAKMRPNERGLVQLALEDAWRLAEKLLPDRPLSQFMRALFEGRKNSGRRQDWARARNYSLLAHGYDPVGPKRWEDEILPFARRFHEALRDEAAACGAIAEAPQLPREPPPALRL